MLSWEYENEKNLDDIFHKMLEPINAPFLENETKDFQGGAVSIAPSSNYQ